MPKNLQNLLKILWNVLKNSRNISKLRTQILRYELFSPNYFGQLINCKFPVIAVPIDERIFVFHLGFFN